MVDIDEADVTVLNQNLLKSKELFTLISKSLNNISSRSINASNKIKPVLADVNAFIDEKKSVEYQLDELKEVKDYARSASVYENALNSPVEAVGVKKYIDTLTMLRNLLKQMKSQIKRYHGILINFENTIDKLDFKLIRHFKGLVENGKFNEILMINKYFHNDNRQINKIFMDSRSGKLVEKMKAVELQHSFKPRPIGPKTPPYEKRSNGITAYCQELLGLLSKEMELLNQLGNQQIFGLVVDKQMDAFGDLMERNYGLYFNETNLVANDLLILELVEAMESFKHDFSAFDDIKKYKVNMTIEKLEILFRQLLKDYFRFIEGRIQPIEKLTDLTSTEIVVELITRIRKLSDYPAGLNSLVSHFHIGEWLNIKLLKFITIYTSVIKNDLEEPQLLTNFISDLIDCIMINVETKMKEYKKSSQGYYLVKNAVLIESIINRSNNLFEMLGTVGMERLNKLKNRFLKLFLDDWNYASYIIIRDMTQLTALSATNQSNELTSKEKDLIKKLFETFNESFEEAVKNYQKFNILDPNLRNFLVGEIKKLIMNAYFKLYDKYGNSGFTKNKSKYIKYNKMQFESILNDRLS